MTDEYCVVLGDVVGSREIPDREAFQERLAAANERINETHAGAIAAPFTILKGVDEIGGVLTTARPLARIQKTLARAAHPERIRLAAVIGAIDVNADADRVSVMDGEALSRADEVLAELESEDLTFRLDGVRPTCDGLISDQINLLDIVRADWSERQLEVITEYERLGTQKAVAEALDVSPQAISKTLRNATGARVLGIERRLDAALQSYPANDETGKANRADGSETETR